ncbi:DUF3802 family protein [Gayadomonas joobiniege]|uniref:DUF3802 family protein n=1 Tax=Gayadomonas joobiniege TaxID=1234606 RepID=UPI000364D058|nr:DUF3802 family protein [Gayadomonas joobiniege]
MVTESQAYIELITYLTENIALFENTDKQIAATEETSLRDVIEEQITVNMVNFFNQHQQISQDMRLEIVRETDAIVTDLEEILASKLKQKANQAQSEFLAEFASLVKNLFDSEINA